MAGAHANPGCLRGRPQGFRLFDLLLIQPIYQASWITGTALNGMLFFQEYVYFNYTQWVMVRALHTSTGAKRCLAMSLTTFAACY